MREPERAGAARCRQQAHAPREMPSSGSFHCPPFPKGPASQGVGPLWLQEHRHPVIIGSTKCRGHCDMERHSPLVDAELHGSCVRICTLMALERRLPAPARSRVYSCAWIPNMDKANPSDASPDSVGTHAPRQYICLAARLAFHQKRKRNASPAHRRPRRTHPQRPLDEPTARRFALAGALLGRRTRLSARSRRAISRRGGAPYSSRPATYPCFCTRAELHAASAPHASDGTPVYAGTWETFTPAEVAARSAVRPPATRLRVPACESPRRNCLVYRPRLRTATADPRSGLRRFPSSGAATGSSPISLPLWLTMQRWE